MGVAGSRSVRPRRTIGKNPNKEVARAPGNRPSCESSMTLSRPDARDPFVVDTRTLGRQPGSMRTVHRVVTLEEDRKSTRLNSSHVSISYAVFCLKKKIYPSERSLNR